MSDQCNLFSPEPNQADLFAAHLPIGGVFDSARESGTNFNKLLIGLGSELYRTEVAIENICKEMDPRQTNDLLPEWERSLGIPDECFTSQADLKTRRQQIILKLRGFRVQTSQDFIDLAAIFNVAIEIEQGASSGTYPMSYSALYLGGAKAARFTMIVRFPELDDNSYPHAYPNMYAQPTGIVECLILNLAPSNVQVIFKYGES